MKQIFLKKSFLIRLKDKITPYILSLGILTGAYFSDLPKSFATDYNGRRGWMLQPPSARVASMGKAFAGTIDDANTVFWNPGGVAFLENLNIECSYIPRFYNREYGYEYKAYSFAFNANFRKSFVIGLNLQRYFLLNQDDFNRSSLAIPLIVEDSIIGLLFGYKRGNIGLGVNTKFLSSYTGGVTSLRNTPVAFDIGTLYSKNFTLKNNYIINTNLGFSILNISNGVKYKGERSVYKEGMPNTIRIGYSMTLKPSKKDSKLIPFNITHNLEYSFITNTDKRYDVDYPSSLGLGLEAVIFEFLYSRAGYFCRKSIENKGNYDGMTYGIGINLSLHRFVKLLPLSINYDYGRIPTPPIIYPFTHDNQSKNSKIHSLKINYMF